MLPLDDVLRAIPHGDIAALATQRAPFRCDVFDDDGSYRPMTEWLPVLFDQGQSIRYRREMLEQGLQYHSPVDGVDVLQHLLAAISRSYPMHIDLQKASVLVVNNRRSLHGRTAFTDHNRRLLRWRVR